MSCQGFGAFIAFHRRMSGLTIREAAEHLGISPAYLSDVENGKRLPFTKERLHRFALMTGLNQSEKEEMYDLAGHERNETSADIAEYLKKNPCVYAALRTAKALEAGPGDWNAMLNDLKKRKGVDDVLSVD